MIPSDNQGAASDRKIPPAVRVTAVILLIAVYAGLTGFCFYLAIHDKSWIAAAVGILILFVTVPALIRLYKMYKQRKG